MQTEEIEVGILASVRRRLNVFEVNLVKASEKDDFL